MIVLMVLDEDGDDDIVMPPLTMATMLLVAMSRVTIIWHTGRERKI